MSSKNVTLAVVVVLIALIGGYFLLKGSSQSTPPTTLQQTSPTISASAPLSSNAPTGQMTVTVSEAGISPSSLTVKAGDSVTFTNTGSQVHQINSNPHPTHTDYPPLNTIGKLDPGQSKSLIFPTAGSYGFHDHLNPDFKGTIIVQ